MICTICEYNYQDLRYRLDAIINELERRIQRYSVSSHHEEAFSKKEECQELLDFIHNLSGSVTYQVWMNAAHAPIPKDASSAGTRNDGEKPINKI